MELIHSRVAHGATLILLTMSLGVLIAQIDTSVVNLAVKQRRLLNTARMIGATLGLAVLGAVFAMFAGGGGEGGEIVAGLAPAYVGGGIAEMIGAATAFVFIRRDALHPAQR
jgi:hypothetical protein